MMRQDPNQDRFRRDVVLSLLLIVPLGFASKLYKGPSASWFNDSVGGLFYEIFWCLVVSFFCTGAREVFIALWVFGVTCFLEFLQLWHPQFLEFIRSTFMGRTLIGHSFHWMDFPYYIMGSFIGGIWIRLLKRRVRHRSRL